MSIFWVQNTPNPSAKYTEPECKIHRTRVQNTPNLHRKSSKLLNFTFEQLDKK